MTGLTVWLFAFAQCAADPAARTLEAFFVAAGRCSTAADLDFLFSSRLRELDR